MHFGGFDTVESAAPAVFEACAETVENISLPENTRIIALGPSAAIGFAIYRTKEMAELILKYTYMGSLGEGYSSRLQNCTTG